MKSNMYGGMRVVVVMQEKGGVGKTTLALNFAVAVANGALPKVKKKTLLFDFDDQQNASVATLQMKRIPRVKAWQPPLHPDYDENDPEDFEWGGRSTAIDLYYGNPVLPYPTTIHPNLEVLPSDGKMLKTFEDRTKKLKEEQGEEIFTAILNELKSFMSLKEVQDEYDMVVIDCPPGINLITAPILRSCTDVIIPLELEPFCVSGIENILTEIEELNSSGEREEPINIAGIVPNKYDQRIKTIHGEILKDLQNDERSIIKDNLLDPVHALVDFKSQWLPLGDPKKNSLKAEARAQMDRMVMQIGKKIYGNSKPKSKARTKKIAV